MLDRHPCSASVRGGCFRLISFERASIEGAVDRGKLMDRQSLASGYHPVALVGPGSGPELATLA